MTTDEEAPSHSIGDFVRGYEEESRLRGFRSKCGFVTATWGLVCPQCGERDLREFSLSGRGRVVALSIQHVPSEEFLNDAPYAYAVVELDEGGRVTGWMPEVREEVDLPLGSRVHFVPGYRPGVQFAKD